MVVKLLFFACQDLFPGLVSFLCFFSAALIQDFYSCGMDVVLMNMLLNLILGHLFLCVPACCAGEQRAPILLLLSFEGSSIVLHLCLVTEANSRLFREQAAGVCFAWAGLHMSADLSVTWMGSF